MAAGWGWSEKKLNNSSLEFIFKTWKGKEDERFKNDKQEWERLRILGSWVLSPYSKNVAPKIILPLPWDIKKSDKEEFEELQPLFDKLEKIK